MSIYRFDSQDTVLALHNNGGTYGADDYLPGGMLAHVGARWCMRACLTGAITVGTYDKDASEVNIVEGSNPSDFFYVVTPYYYNALGMFSAILLQSFIIFMYYALTDSCYGVQRGPSGQRDRNQ